MSDKEQDRAVEIEAQAAMQALRDRQQAFLMDKTGRFTIPVELMFTHKVYDSRAQVGLQNAEDETPLLLAEYAKFEEAAKLLKEAMQQAGIPEVRSPVNDQQKIRYNCGHKLCSWSGAHQQTQCTKK